MAYIDVKTVVWQRMVISDSSKVDAIKKHLEAGKLPDDLFYEDDVASLLGADIEILFDTEELMDTSDNEGFATVELFNDAHEKIWANGLEEG